MYDEDQTVQIKWNNTNREWYTKKGYHFTKRYDTFTVRARDLSEGSKAKIDAVCDYCGAQYITQNDVLRHGRVMISKDACPKCAGKKASEVSYQKRADRYYSDLEAICNELNYELLTEKSEFTGLCMRIRYRCKKHGIREAILDNLLRGHGCLLCSYESRFDSVRHDKRYVEAVINHVDGNTLLNPDEYKNMTDRNLRIRCRCGNEYCTSFSNFLKHGVTSCYACSCKESNGETLVRRFLEDHDIRFVPEKRFKDCRDKKPLPFDFFLPDYDICIEFDGKQHFEDIDGFCDYDTVRRHDEIKNRYCTEHGIRMIRIPYYHGDMIDQILEENIIV